jgi:hypothetical protein
MRGNKYRTVIPAPWDHQRIAQLELSLHGIGWEWRGIVLPI